LKVSLPVESSNAQKEGGREVQPSLQQLRAHDSAKVIGQPHTEHVFKSCIEGRKCCPHKVLMTPTPSLSVALTASHAILFFFLISPSVAQHAPYTAAITFTPPTPPKKDSSLPGFLITIIICCFFVLFVFLFFLIM